ncbi:hypothetical protein [Rhizobium sp. L1K21]|uniref:hypothetical protein n=1 Tax=Rhizobium sp. L1K21 TaxID=2954933 RepID=UPI0020936C75|nr:hypothetical protein [Rhizobium sp. L1K21]MCO6188611.1 hypothetical protein [Rhizobium sp. L1K21]
MSEQRETLRLEGALTIKTISDVKDRIVASLDAADARGVPLQIEIDEDADCDLTMPQLLLSALKTAQAKGVELVVNAPKEGAFPATLQRGGFLAAGAKNREFWANGVEQ